MSPSPALLALRKAIEETGVALSGISATLALIHNDIAAQPKLCDALCMIESLCELQAARLDAAAFAAGITS